MSCMNVHKAILGSQLSIFDMVPFARAHPHPTRPNELTRTPSNDRPQRFYMGGCTTKMKPQGKAGQTSCMNVHKANLGSQLSTFDMGSFAHTLPHPNDPPKRVDSDALKRPARNILHMRPHDQNEATKESWVN